MAKASSGQEGRVDNEMEYVGATKHTSAVKERFSRRMTVNPAPQACSPLGPSDCLSHLSEASSFVSIVCGVNQLLIYCWLFFKKEKKR